jgi:hypothetical protein
MFSYEHSLRPVMIDAEFDREDHDLIPTIAIEKGPNHFMLELTHELD